MNSDALIWFLIGGAVAGAASYGIKHLAGQQIKKPAEQIAKDTANIVGQAQALKEKRQELDAKQQDLALRQEDKQKALASILALTPGEARTQLKQELQAELEQEILPDLATQLQAKSQQDEQQARALFLSVIERNAARWTGDTTQIQVELPSDEFKGRLIGRDGRNFKAFEQITGVSLIVDETPKIVFLSSFDPIRRAQAELTLASLILDGRIHPGRIEELHAEIVKTFNDNLIFIGRDAAEEAAVSNLTDETLIAMGRLQFRNSLSQNMLKHSVEVSNMAAALAAELGLDTELARRAGLLHDIGKALGPEWGPSHALAGKDFLQTQKEKPDILNAVAAHHYEITPETPEAIAVIAADQASGSRPGARHATSDPMPARMARIEASVKALNGVKDVHVFDGGKEIRVFVKPDEVSDAESLKLAKRAVRVAKEANEYPVPIKVTVIRETRVVELSS